jgi:hypothetical protein
MLALPETSLVDGSNDDHPLILPGLSVEDFRVFVQASLSQYGHPCAQLHTSFRLTFELRSAMGLIPRLYLSQWTIVLRLADMWQMENLRSLSIREMSPKFDQHNAAEQLVVARKYGIDAWIRESVRCLVMRVHSLSDDEVEKMGVRDAMKIMRIREDDFRGRLASCDRHYPLEQTVESYEVQFTMVPECYEDEMLILSSQELDSTSQHDNMQ